MWIRSVIAITTLVVVQNAIATGSDSAREEMQRELNRETMATPFNAGDIKKATAYAEEAKRQNLAPVATAPSYWVPGWTCASMTGYRYYNYTSYRDCVYYHHYHGRYWR